jgi:site-specific recombinase XerD
LATLQDCLTAYKVCAKSEGKSPRTIEWVTSSVGYFREFLGNKVDITELTADDLRRFVLACRDSHKFRNHPFAKAQKEKLSPQSVETYVRAIRSFFSYLYREELIGTNPMQKIKMPKVPKR